MRCPLVFILFLFFFVRTSAQDIFEAARKGDLKRIEFLYKLKPDTINSKNESDFTPLIIAVYRYQKEAANLLIKFGANVDADSPEGTALMAAVYKNNLEITEMLLNHKANPNVSNQEGVTPLMYAAMGNHKDCLQLLLSIGADKKSISKSGHSALSYAQMYNHTESILLLSK